MFAGMVLCLVLVFTVPFARDFFALDMPSWNVLIEALLLAAAAALLLELGWRITSRWARTRRPEPEDDSRAGAQPAAGVGSGSAGTGRSSR